MGFRKRRKYPEAIVIGFSLGILVSLFSTGYIFLQYDSQILKNMTNTALDFIDLVFAAFFLIGILVTKKTFNAELGPETSTFFGSFFATLSFSTHVLFPYLMSPK